MFYLREAVVKEILERSNGITKVKICIGKKISHAINYEKFTGSIETGDKVMVNTTANKLNLGSGGYDIVYFNENNKSVIVRTKGHIMKERYTPWQFPVLSIEEQKSEHHELFKQKLRLDGIPVAVGSVHSQLPAFCFTLKYLKPRAKIVYVMTDGAALPLALSRIVKVLKENKVIEKTVTYGQAFGGDIESVNIFSALAAASHIYKPDAIVVLMGPGITGTGTELGFTGIEQGQILNAVNALGGKPVAISRISFADIRARHRGLSHHTVTALDIGCQVGVDMPLPRLKNDMEAKIKQQVSNSILPDKHRVSFHESLITLSLLEKNMPWVSTMGRKISEEKEFFQAAGAAAYKIAQYIK